MSAFVEKWREFQEQAHRQVLYEKVLNEISYDNYEKIKDWLADQGDQALPFNDLFDGKMRLVIPLGAAISPESDIGRLFKYLERNGWTPDLKTGLATREAKPPNPNIPAAVRNVTGVGAGQPRTEKQKIGKLLAKALRLTQRFIAAAEARREYHQEKIDTLDWGDNEGRDKVIKSKEYLDLYDKEKKAEEAKDKIFPAFGRWDIEKLQPLIDFWNKKSQFYRENPEKAGTDYSIIISRHPVDVVRMSDFAMIHSCHSEGSEYFHCAMGEAKGNGPIAYVVETKDLEEVDLEDEEIFEDGPRGIDGIEPISRIRLRRFQNHTRGEDLAVPEIRTYGADVPNFYEKLKSWALENQPQFKEAVNDEGVIDPKYMGEFTRTGGSYSDNTASDLFNKFFKEYQPKFTGDVIQDSDDEEGDPNEELWQEYERESADIERGADVHHCWVGYDVEDTGEGFPAVYFNGGINFEFSTEDFLQDLPSGYTEKKPLYSDIDEVLGENIADLYIEDTLVRTDGDNVTVTVQFDPWASGHYGSDPNGFESFVQDVERVEAEYPELRRLVRSAFVMNEYLEPTSTDVLLARLEEDELKFEHFKDLDRVEGDIILSLDVSSLNIIKIGPVRNEAVDEFFEMIQNTYEDGTIYQPSPHIESEQLNIDIIGQMQKELHASIAATNKQLKLFGQGKKQIELPLHVDPVTPNYLTDYIIDNIQIQLRAPAPALPASSAIPGIIHEPGPGATKVARYAGIRDIRFTFNERIDPATMDAAINFLQYLDKNFDKLIEKISGLLQVADVAYSKKYVEGRAGQQGKIDSIFKMIDIMQKVEVDDPRGRTVGEVSDSLVNQLETLITSIDVKSAILNNDYSKLNKKKVKALQSLLPQVVHIYKKFKNLGKVQGNIPVKQLTLEERIQRAIYKAIKANTKTK